MKSAEEQCLSVHPNFLSSKLLNYSGTGSLNTTLGGKFNSGFCRSNTTSIYDRPQSNSIVFLKDGSSKNFSTFLGVQIALWSETWIVYTVHCNECAMKWKETQNLIMRWTAYFWLKYWILASNKQTIFKTVLSPPMTHILVWMFLCACTWQVILIKSVTYFNSNCISKGSAKFFHRRQGKDCTLISVLSNLVTPLTRSKHQDRSPPSTCIR
jgi:hypothetical protein